MDDAQIEALAAKLLVFGFDGSGTKPNVHACNMIRQGAGGVILFGRNVDNPKQVTELCENLKRQAGDRKLLIMVDQEGGRVARLAPPLFTAVPSAHTLSTAMHKLSAAASAGEVLGKEVRAVNIDMNLAPIMDVDTNPANPVIGERAFSRNPAVVSKMGAAWIHAMQDQGVAACAKHFPGHGDTSKDSHLELPSVPHSLSRLQSVELPPFQAAVDARVAAVMVAHVTAPALDEHGNIEKPGSMPASMSAGAVGYLRNHMGYKGVILTDDMEMGALKDFGIAEAVTAGLQAGIDMFLVCHTEKLQKDALNAMVQAVKDGRVSVDRLQESVDRIDALMEKYVPELDIGASLPNTANSSMTNKKTNKLQIVGSAENRDIIKNILTAGFRE
mmetsp:Transcript_11282/g.21363  ORF Transcript_11282/g.21363 Transcript_11282/m.21363 type:complete len:387 (-) Transcript_11282:208-1368(-)